MFGDESRSRRTVRYARIVLTRLQLTHFRAFESATIDLGPVTAFVGPNACGKSTILTAAAGGVLFSQRDARGRAGEWRIDRRMISIDRTDAATNVGSMPLQLPRLGTVLQLRVEEMRAQRQASEWRRMDEHGGQLVNVLATIPRRQREALATRFCELVPVFGDVDVRPSGRGHQRVVFQDKWSTSTWYEPHEVSDGSLFALALLTLAYQPEATELIAIEEPEHGLHPHLIGSIVDLMRELSTRESSPIQFLLATQSSDLLEHLKPEEVRFLTRAEDGSVTVVPAPVDTPSWREAYEAHQSSLSSLWLSGAMGGVP